MKATWYEGMTPREKLLEQMHVLLDTETEKADLSANWEQQLNTTVKGANYESYQKNE